MPIYELALFKPTEKVVKYPEAALTTACKFLATVSGFLGLYFGVSEENPDVAFLMIAWEAFNGHLGLIDTPGYPEEAELLGVVASAPVALHIHFRDAPEPALEAPVTEILIQTLKSGKTVADLEGVLSPLAPKLGTEEGCIAGTWGETEEKDKLVLVLGWTSSKRHFEVVGQDNYKPLIADLFAVVDIQMYHTAFKKFA